MGRIQNKITSGLFRALPLRDGNQIPAPQPRAGTSVFVILRVATIGIILSISFLALTQWASGTTFNPTLSASLSDNRPSQFPDRTENFGIPAPDANSSLVVTFTPHAFCVASMANDCSTVTVDAFGNQTATGPAVPLGTETGTQSSTWNLALTTVAGELNTTCNTTFFVPFTFYAGVTKSPGPVLNVIGGKVDVNNNGIIDAGDTGIVSGRHVIAGLFDVNGSNGDGNGTAGETGAVPTGDQGLVEYKKQVINGFVDVNGDGAINTGPNGPDTSSLGGLNTQLDSGIVSGDPIAVPNDPLVIQSNTPHGAGTLPNGVALYPNYLVTSLEPAGAGPGTALVPRLRTWSTLVVSSTTVILQFLTFDKGALVALGIPNTNMSPVKGWPTDAILQDPDPYAAGNSQISDFCTPLKSTTVTFGTSLPGLGGAPGGAKMGRNPLPGLTVTGDGTNASMHGVGNTGTHLEYVTAISLRDADNDGIENQFDTCPFIANIDGDPRTTNGPDNNGLDEACDPHIGTNPLDEDGDGWPNRLDNCPLVANGGPGFNDPSLPPNTPPQQDTDQPVWVKPAGGGPPVDGIGNACDPNPTTPDGHVHMVEIKTGVCVGDDGTGPNQDADLNDASTPAPDGWCKAREAFLGTSPTDNCGTIASPEPNTWPPDFTGDGRAENLDRSRLSREIFGGYIPVQTLVADPGTGGTGTIDVSGGGTALTNIQNGDTIQLDPGTASNEHMLVVSGGSVAGPSTLTVTRGVDGTTQVTHLAGVKIFRYNRRFDLNADGVINATDRTIEVIFLGSGNNGAGTTDPNGVSCSP